MEKIKKTTMVGFSSKITQHLVDRHGHMTNSQNDGSWMMIEIPARRCTLLE